MTRCNQFHFSHFFFHFYRCTGSIIPALCHGSFTSTFMRRHPCPGTFSLISRSFYCTGIFCGLSRKRRQYKANLKEKLALERKGLTPDKRFVKAPALFFYIFYYPFMISLIKSSIIFLSLLFIFSNSKKIFSKISFL